VEDLRNGSVVEWAVDDEQTHVRVRGPGLRYHAQDANRSGDGNQECEAEGRAGVIQDHADEGDGNDAAERERDVKEVVDLDGLRVIAKQVFVLRPDRGDEVVDARHLHYGEEGDQDEPRALDLLERGVTVKSTPDT